jgi:transposase
MVTNNQVRKLIMLVNNEHSIKSAAMKSGMDEKTARKYVRSRKLPSQLKSPRDWSTRKDPFEHIWPTIKHFFENEPHLQAKTVFDHVLRTYPGLFEPGQLRTFQRKVKRWRALEGPNKEVYFPQVHHPGELCESDFTDMSGLGVTINHQRLPHMVFHFVLTYSNWEAGRICYSESFESLSEGLQYALWKLGGVPALHRTDRLSAAVYNDLSSREFTHRYVALLSHYGLKPQRTNAQSPHENGDIEQRHYRFKKAVEQSLMLRGSYDFASVEVYSLWLDKLIDQLNTTRKVSLAQEKKLLGPLPERRIDAFKRLRLRVGPWSTVRVGHNTYSVNSRLIGEQVDVHVYVDHIQVWHGQTMVDRLPRLRGEYGHRIEYRHVIDSLVRKPGAFKNYRYKQDLFPTHRFRMAFDMLTEQLGAKADRAYLRLLFVAARVNESAVDQALQQVLGQNIPLDIGLIETLVESSTALTDPEEIMISPVELSHYDRLLEHAGGLV